MNQTGGIKKGMRRAALSVLGVAALGLAGMAGAWASPVVNWTYSATAQFGSASFTHPGGCQIAGLTEIQWGQGGNSTSCSSPKSSLVINPASTTGQTVVTNGATTDLGLTLTHNNFTLPSSAPTLVKTSLITTITLTDPSGAPAIPDLNQTINFDETPNAGTCVVGSNPCPDIFVLTGNTLNHQFSYGGDDYFLSLFPSMSNGDLSVLPNAACGALGSSNGCLGFITQEGKSNDMHFGVRITSAPIATPEPGVLGMMGLGLLAIAGLAIRRRKTRVEHD